MKRWYLLPSVLAVLSLGGLTPPARGLEVNVISDDTADVDDTTSPRRQQPEPTIAINPRNTQIIAAGAQDFRRAAELRAACDGDRWNGLYFSINHGQTWGNSLVPGFCTDPTEGSGSEQAVSEMFGLSTNTDPVLAFDAFGNLYYTHIAFNNNRFRTVPPSASGVLFVSTYRVSDTGDITYAKTVKVPSGSGLRQASFKAGPGNSNFDDKQWVTVDNSPASPFYGRVYVTWTKFNAQGGQSSIWVSSCGGNGEGNEVCAEFTRGHVVNKPVPGGLVQESSPATAPDGTLYIAFIQFQGGFGSTRPHSGVWILKSTDGGDTFTQQQVVDIRQIPSPIPPASATANDGLNSFRTGTAPGVAVTDNGAVHLVWGEWVGGTDAEVRYSRSTDGGETWSAPISMNDVATGHQFFPAIAASGSTVHVAWYDSRLDPAGGGISALDVFYNRSTNAGQTFEPDVRLTTQSFNPNLVSRFPVFCAAFIGDYIDIDAVGNTVAVIWNDNRNVVDPLTPAECTDFSARSTDAAIQSTLDSGALDQEAFVFISP
jgi:BNR/Asp-box repeat